MHDSQQTNQRDLFNIALGFTNPWSITEVAFSKDNGRLDIFLKHERGAHFKCSSCGDACGVHDTTERTWRHLNFFQYETYLHAPVPRIHCSSCNSTRNVELPWARPNSGFTLLFEALVMQLSRAMPLSTVAGIMKEHDTRLMRIIEHYVSQAREETQMDNIHAIGTDETSKAKGHSYVTTFIDMARRRVLFATEGKDNSTVQRFVEDLEQHGGKPNNIKEACIDLSPAFTKGIKEQLPSASIVYDRFHVMKIITDAQDKVRREECANNVVLKGSRYAFLHNPETATDNQTATLVNLTKLNLKTVRAYQIRLALREVYLLTDYAKAEAALKKWYFWATHSRIEPIIKAAKTIKAHWEGILAFFRNRTANGLAEGINSVIQTIKRRARGYRNTQNFITMIYLVCGKLDFKLPGVCGVNPR